jgi:hypothetical protein
MKIDEKSKETAIIAMNKLIGFIGNIPYDYVTYQIPWSGETKIDWLPEFIKDVKWTCNTEHIVSKWKKCLKDSFDYPDKAFILFYYEIDSKNSRALLNYIIDKYDNENKI